MVGVHVSASAGIFAKGSINVYVRDGIAWSFTMDFTNN